MKEFPIKVIEEIQELTDWNSHTDARIVTAETCGRNDLVEAYEGVMEKQISCGSLTDQLYEIRRELDEELFDYVKSNFSNGQDVYMAM